MEPLKPKICKLIDDIVDVIIRDAGYTRLTGLYNGLCGIAYSLFCYGEILDKKDERRRNIEVIATGYVEKTLALMPNDLDYRCGQSGIYHALLKLKRGQLIEIDLEYFFPGFIGKMTDALKNAYSLCPRDYEALVMLSDYDRKAFNSLITHVVEILDSRLERRLQWFVEGGSDSLCMYDFIIELESFYKLFWMLDIEPRTLHSLKSYINFSEDMILPVSDRFKIMLNNWLEDVAFLDRIQMQNGPDLDIDLILSCITSRDWPFIFSNHQIRHEVIDRILKMDKREFEHFVDRIVPQGENRYSYGCGLSMLIHSLLRYCKHDAEHYIKPSVWACI